MLNDDTVLLALSSGTGSVDRSPNKTHTGDRATSERKAVPVTEERQAAALEQGTVALSILSGSLHYNLYLTLPILFHPGGP